jgi:hypothetical protein
LELRARYIACARYGVEKGISIERKCGHLDTRRSLLSRKSDCDLDIILVRYAPNTTQGHKDHAWFEKRGI